MSYKRQHALKMREYAVTFTLMTHTSNESRTASSSREIKSFVLLKSEYGPCTDQCCWSEKRELITLSLSSFPAESRAPGERNGWVWRGQAAVGTCESPDHKLQLCSWSQTNWQRQGGSKEKVWTCVIAKAMSCDGHLPGEEEAKTAFHAFECMCVSPCKGIGYFVCIHWYPHTERYIDSISNAYSHMHIWESVPMYCHVWVCMWILCLPLSAQMHICVLAPGPVDMELCGCQVSPPA